MRAIDVMRALTGRVLGRKSIDPSGQHADTCENSAQSSHSHCGMKRQKLAQPGQATILITIGRSGAKEVPFANYPVRHP